MKLIKNANVWYNGKYEKLDLKIDNGVFKEIKKNINCEADLDFLNYEDKYIYPGFIDAHTHVGIYEEGVGANAGNDVNETSNPANASLKAIDAINPYDIGFKKALESGVTTVCVLPGSSNVIGGEALVLNTYGNNVEDMQIKTAKKMLKMALGRNPVWFWSKEKKYPSTRMGSVALLREKLIQANNYKLKNDGQIDIEMDFLVKLLNKDMVARIHVANLEDIETIDRLSNEYNFEYILEHATSLHTNVEFAKKLNTMCVLGPLKVAKKSFQTYDLTFNSVKILYQAGLKLSIMTDAPVIPLNLTFCQLYLIDRLDIARGDIIDMFTINPARLLGIDDILGSIEENKSANFFIMDNEIFNYKSKVIETYIDGELRYSLN